jgi:hypothetical protein
MNRLAKLIQTIIGLIIIGALLVQTKRIAKWIFWPLFVFLHFLLSIIIPSAIALFSNVFICQLILGTYYDVLDSWIMYPLAALSYLILLPGLYNAISMIEEVIDNKVTDISIAGKLFGYTWGIIANAFVLYRLHFFDDF